MTDARLDLDRTRRIDLPEAVYCHHKTVEQCTSIVGDLLDAAADAVIATRATASSSVSPCSRPLKVMLVGAPFSSRKPFGNTTAG